MKEMSYYKVTCLRGHMGTHYNNAYITFYIVAENALHAMNVARRFGGVKHGRMPEKCEKITREEYEAGKRENAYKRAMAK